MLSGLCERNDGRSDDGLHCLRVGERLGDVCSIMRLGVDEEALETAACPYGDLLVIGVARPDMNLDLEGGESTKLNKAITVFATRDEDSLVASMRSSRRNRSSLGSPYDAQAARNLVTLDVLIKPSSRGSGRTIELDRSLFMNLCQWSK